MLDRRDSHAFSRRQRRKARLSRRKSGMTMSKVVDNPTLREAALLALLARGVSSRMDLGEARGGKGPSVTRRIHLHGVAGVLLAVRAVAPATYHAVHGRAGPGPWIPGAGGRDDRAPGAGTDRRARIPCAALWVPEARANWSRMARRPAHRLNERSAPRPAPSRDDADQDPPGSQESALGGVRAGTASTSLSSSPPRRTGMPPVGGTAVEADGVRRHGVGADAQRVARSACGDPAGSLRAVLRRHRLTRATS